MRGCDPQWLRSLYGYSRRPDITFYFGLPLEVALGRILDGRPQLKYLEAGMDLGLASDIKQSFRLFQERVMEQYALLASEFGFITLDATRPIHEQQELVRSIVGECIDLAQFRRRSRQ